MRKTRKSTFKARKRKKILNTIGIIIRIFLCIVYITYFMTAVTAETVIKPLIWNNTSSETASTVSKINNASTVASRIDTSGISNKSSLETISKTASDKISLNVENADIRDVLSAIALGLDLNIIFMEQSQRVSFRINNVTYLTALEYLLKSNGLDYLVNDNIIIVGKSETLQNDFFNKPLLARFDLNYITAKQLSSQIDALEISVKKIIFDENEKSIWVQGTSQYISKVKELISMVDIPENAIKEAGLVQGIVKLLPYELKHIDAATFENFIKQLGMDIKTITIDTNPKKIWVSAKEEEIAELEELIKTIDVEENKLVAKEDIPLKLIPYELEFVSSDRINSIITQMGIDVKVLCLSSNPYKIWLDSRSKDIADFEELIDKIDIMENGKWFLEVTTLKLKYLTADRFKAIINQLDIPVQVITLDSNAYTVWVSGTPRDIIDIKLLLRDIDTDNIREDSAFYIHKLSNISPQEAVTRFEYLQITDAKVFTLNFPLFSKEILVVCKPDRKEEIAKAIDGIDVKGEKIKVPVDYSTDAAGQSRLASRRDLLVSLTGIPATSFFISNNVSRDSTPRYIMWVEETPENIRKILDMITTIDSF
ncbi:MAG: hypothetical protein HPY74_01375 [Firmicutes bacterium]|nr:hypothetical protein [Bacillota bacterium]